jgi:hypothetical protein
MAVQPWKIYATAIKKIGDGTMALGAGVFKMSLHRSAATGAITALSTRDKWSSVGNEISARGSYAAGGRPLLPGAGKWSIGASAKQYRFSYTTAGIPFTASGSSLNAIKFALLRKSAGSTTSGHVLCYCSLTSTPFAVTSPNILTIIPATVGGVFTMA